MSSRSTGIPAGTPPGSYRLTLQLFDLSARAALPIWMDIAKRILPEQAPPFSQPSGVVVRAIDPKTGQLATSQCPEQVDEVFIEGTEPSVYCEVHGGGIWERLRQTFGFS